MMALLLSLTLFLQGAALQNDNGTVSGVLKTSGGQPAVGVRVAAMAICRIVEEADGKPIPHGSVTILGRTRTTISIDQDGKFFIPHLLPGSYDLRVEVFEHFTRYETIVIDDQDIHVDLAVRSALATAEEILQTGTQQ